MSLAALALAATVAAVPEDDLAVVWLREGRIETHVSSARALPERVPLGSAWKLFVYAYVVDQGVEAPAYRCAAPRRPEEEYCCAPGQEVSRDEALARSCGLFFEPARLAMDAARWRAYWRGRTDDRAAWLMELDRLRPSTLLPVDAILHALDAVPSAARLAADRALLPVVVEAGNGAALTRLGATLRVKTFTWDHPRERGARLGGGAGWLLDGTPVWFAGRGAGRQVLAQQAARLAEQLPAPRELAFDDTCVAVDYFTRYPIRAVDRLPSREPAPEAPLDGTYRVLFANGQTVRVSSTGELRLDLTGTRPRIVGRLHLEDYVARVIDREADATTIEAARALAIVARTWLRQNAPFVRGCFQVEDSTRMQRVSPRPPSAAARRAALFTHGLLLRGEPVRYALDGDGPGVLGWSDAVRRARAGARFDEILGAAFPRASLAAGSGEEECTRLLEAEDWLAGVAPRWNRALAAEPGFEPPPRSLTVCALGAGNPYSDRERRRVHVRGWRTREDRVALAHEYLHLALPFHPNGSDEAFVERRARALADGETSR